MCDTCITRFAGNTAKAEKQEEKVHLQRKHSAYLLETLLCPCPSWVTREQDSGSVKEI